MTKPPAARYKRTSRSLVLELYADARGACMATHETPEDTLRESLRARLEVDEISATIASIRAQPSLFKDRTDAKGAFARSLLVPSVGALSAPTLEQGKMGGAASPCAGASSTAYASLLTLHPGGAKSTFLAARQGTARHSAETDALLKQVNLLLVLMRSLKRVWECKRDFVLLTGQHVVPNLPAKAMNSLRAEGVILHSIPIMLPGVPAVDKLYVWRLTNYTKILVLDADIMVLRSLDAAFEFAEEFAIAHHPHDMIQAQCGLPPERRGVSAMFAARPNLATLDGLTAYLRTFNAFHLRHYSEQTALACYFANRSRTLPLEYLYDIANPLHSPGARRWLSNCETYGPSQMRSACFVPGRKACEPFASRSGYIQPFCSNAMERLTSHYEWSLVAGSVRAVHFKGKVKPWGSEGHKIANLCDMSSGSLKVNLADRDAPTGSTNATPARARLIRVQPNDTLSFDPNQRYPVAKWDRPGVCFSKRWNLPVYFGRRTRANNRRGLPVHRRCCNFETLLTAHWNNILFRRPT